MVFARYEKAVDTMSHKYETDFRHDVSKEFLFILNHSHQGEDKKIMLQKFKSDLFIHEKWIVVIYPTYATTNTKHSIFTLESMG